MTKEESDALNKLLADLNEELDDGTPRPPEDDSTAMDVVILPPKPPRKSS